MRSSRLRALASWWLGAGLALAAVLGSAPGGLAAEPAAARGATAQQRAKARSLADRGFQLFQAERYDEALDRFREAEQIIHAPTLGLMIARTQEKRGELLAALAAYESLVAERLPADAAAEFRKAQDDARAELEALKLWVPRFELRLSGPRALERVGVAIDGRELDRAALREPLFVALGEHTIAVTAAGAAPLRRTVTFARGQVEPVEFAVPALPPARRAPPTDGASADGDGEGSIIPAAVAFGVGGVGLAMGVTAGVVALDRQSELEERCPTRWCVAEDEELADTAELNATLSTVGFVVAGVGVAAGVTLLLLRDGGEEAALPTAEVRWRIGPSSATVTGRF